MKVELLAPGGSYDSALAALNAGADAVYVGGEKFGARANADNLTTQQLLDLIRYAHIHSKKVYLTINTLLKDSEIKGQLYDFLAPLYEEGLDAVIIQDIGVMLFVKEKFPHISIHLSTQMTIFGKYTAHKLKNLGADRIVVPRELSLKEISDISCNVDIEIESFVHGALCYCYSGQCLLSSYIGGRSGNRGRCAQPCRMEYDVIKEGRALNKKNEKYVLSPKDICTLNILPRIIESGVYSLKIEGRMKKLEYIAGVVNIYRKYIDLYLKKQELYKVEKRDIQLLSDLFNRNGFSEGYYKNYNSKDMISIKKPGFRAENREFTEYLRQNFSGKKLKKLIDIKIACIRDKKITISTEINGKIITVYGEKPFVAEKKPIDKETIEKQIRRTGNTDFLIDNVNIEMDDNLFVPISSLNNLRRNFIDSIINYCVSEYRRKIPVNKEFLNENLLLNEEINKEKTRSTDIGISVCVSNMEQLRAVVNNKNINNIYLEEYSFKKEDIRNVISLIKSGGKQIFLVLPYIFRKKDKEKFNKNLLNYVKLFDGVIIRSIEQYEFLKERNVAKKYIFDYNVYVYNNYSKRYYESDDNITTTVPLELNRKELMNRGCDNEEMIIYGYIPVMVSANCSLKTCDRCEHKNDLYSLKDKLGNTFITRCVCDNCYNIMYNCNPLSLINYYKEVKDLNVKSVRINFTFESGIECKEILDKALKGYLYNKKTDEINSSTRGHFKRGVI